MDTCGYESVLLSSCMLPFSVSVSRFVARVLCWMREYFPPLLFAAALVIVSNCVRVSRGLVSVCVTPGATRPGPPFTTEIPCANAAYERGLPMPRSLTFQEKVRSVAEVRVT